MPITELRAIQREALPTLDWLFNPNIRQTGKSLVMALAIVRAACKHPGKKISIIDHVDLDAARNRTRQYVLQLAETDPQLRRHVVCTDRTITINLPESLDWFPPDMGICVSPPKPKKAKKPPSKWKLLGKI